MSKFKYINKKGNVSVILKPVSGEQINNGEAAYLAGNFIKGFLRPAADGSGKIIFSGAQGISLSQFLRRPVNKDQFYIVIAQLLEAYKIIVMTNLNPAKINLDPDFITINENTGELYLVYQPIVNPQSPNQGFMRCFAQICSMLKYASPQDQANISGFIAFASRLNSFSVNDIEGYIMSASPITYNHVQRTTFTESPAAPVPATPIAPAAPEPPLSDFSPKAHIPEDPVDHAPAAQDNMTGNFEAPVPPLAVPEEPSDVPVSPEKEDSKTPARLIRRSNSDVIHIDKDTFVIGKERARVNYCVTDNNTVSRVHATIFQKNDGYYVVDNNSTNRTFVNGSPIPSMTEIKLNNKDVLKLSNEEFDFMET